MIYAAHFFVRVMIGIMYALAAMSLLEAAGIIAHSGIAPNGNLISAYGTTSIFFGVILFGITYGLDSAAVRFYHKNPVTGDDT